MQKTTLTMCLSLLLTACSNVFEYHPYDTKVSGEKHLNSTNIQTIEQSMKDKTTLRLAFIGDTQGWLDETEDIIEDINNRKDIDFVVHGGDLTNYGDRKDFLWQRDLLQELRVPYVVLIGNHDCLGTGRDVYRELFGPTDFSFVAARTLFLCLNTNALEYDYTEPIPNFSFIQQTVEQRRGDYDQTVVVMHAPPFNEQFNNNVNQLFGETVRQLPGILFCMAAHVHRIDIGELFDDGITYFTTDCAKHRQYLIFEIKEGGYSYEIVEC